MYMYACASMHTEQTCSWVCMYTPPHPPHTHAPPTLQALQKKHLATVVFGPGHHALGGSLVHDDGRVEALGEGESQGHQPDASNNCSGAGG